MHNNNNNRKRGGQYHRSQSSHYHYHHSSSPPPAPLSPSISDDTIAEAKHYCDVIFHYESYFQHSVEKFERFMMDFECLPTNLQQLVPHFHDRMRKHREGIWKNFQFIREITAHRYIFQNAQEVVSTTTYT